MSMKIVGIIEKQMPFIFKLYAQIFLKLTMLNKNKSIKDHFIKSK